MRERIAYRTVGPAAPIALKAAREKFLAEDHDRIEQIRADFAAHVGLEPGQVAFCYNTATGYISGFAVGHKLVWKIELRDDSPWRQERGGNFVPAKRKPAGKAVAELLEQLPLWAPWRETRALGLPLTAWGEGYAQTLSPDVVTVHETYDEMYDGVSPLWIHSEMPGAQKALAEAIAQSPFTWEEVPGSELMRLIEERNATRAALAGASA